MYVDGSGSLWSLQSHNLFTWRDALKKNWFHWTDYKLSSNYDWEVCWPAHQFHLSRTHDGDDEELSKDIVMGLQGRHVHIALSFCTLIGVVPWWNYSPWRHYSCSTDAPTVWTEFVLLSPSTKFYSLHQAQLINSSWRIVHINWKWAIFHLIPSLGIIRLWG